MDVFQGRAVPDFSNQIPEFNPGVNDVGLLWTAPLPWDAVTVDLASASAEMAVRELPVFDYFTIVNALHQQAGQGDPQRVPIAAHISLTIRWGTEHRRFTLRRSDQGFAGDYVLTDSQIDWSAAIVGLDGVTEILR